MKSLMKIIRRYIGTAFFITFSILLLNIFINAGLIIHYGASRQSAASISNISGELTKTEQGFVLSAKGEEMLKGYAWAFLLDDDGNVIWSQDMPEDFSMKYTSSEIASFSKWYLKDYPVKVWKHSEGLLVLGQEKDSVWKSQLVIEYDLVSHGFSVLGLFLIANVVIILLFCLVFGLRFYYSLKPLAAGIENLAKEESILLPEKGMTEELAAKLNQTSRLLEKQQSLIAARDNARTNWIAGVSHDIRTPLSMIMGYSEQLENAPNLDAEQRNQIHIIKNQSIKIKKLIEDLNLTSKLQYEMQPSRKQEYDPAKHMRQLVVSYYNGGLPEQYEINLDISEEVESIKMEADTALLTRAFENLIGNSIKHNAQGCKINIIMQCKAEYLDIKICDDGCGISEAVKTILLEDKLPEEGEAPKPESGENLESDVGKPHVMGLHVVKQIILSHKGQLEFPETKKGTVVEILLPVLKS